MTLGSSPVTPSGEWGDYFTRTAMPPLRLEGFNVSSVSQASQRSVGGYRARSATAGQASSSRNPTSGPT